MKALGILPDFEAARPFLKTKQLYIPDAERHEVYKACLRNYEKAAARLAPLF